MNQSGNSRITLKTYVNAVHPFFCIFIPFAFFIVIVALVNPLIKQVGQALFPPLYAILLLLVGISETISANLLYKERIGGILPRLREFVFVAGISLLLLLLLQGDIFKPRFQILRFKVVVPYIFLLLNWWFSYYIHQRLRNRELFLRFFEGKDGTECKETYRSYMHEASESFQGMRSIRKLVISFMVMVFISFIMTSWGLQYQYSAFEKMLIITFFISFILLASTLGSIMHNQLMMMDGHVVPVGQKRRKFGLAVMLLAVVLLLVIPATGKESILPSRYLTDLSKWLQEILQFKDLSPEVRRNQQTINARGIDRGLENLSMLGEETKVMDLSGLFTIIGRTLLVLLGIGAVAFLFMPLIKRLRRGVHLKEFTAKSWTAILSFSRGFIAACKNYIDALAARRKAGYWNRFSNRIRAAEKREKDESLMKDIRRGISRKERRFNSRMLKNFFRFVRWGEKQGIPFATNLGPLEYATRVVAAQPQVAQVCEQIASMFEEALFSNHDIGATFQAEFSQIIRQATRRK